METGVATVFSASFPVMMACSGGGKEAEIAVFDSPGSLLGPCLYLIVLGNREILSAAKVLSPEVNQEGVGL